MNLKFAKHRLSRRLTFRGLPISIETDKGELRHWFDPHENKSGTTKMRVPYGYIRRTEGVDGDHVDCYVGPHGRAHNVYVVHQMKAPAFKTYDEDKCMLGFLSAEDAKRAYLAHYNKSGFFGSMTTMPFEEFEKKVKATFEEPKKLAQVDAVLLKKEAARRLVKEIKKVEGLLKRIGHPDPPNLPYLSRNILNSLPQHERDLVGRLHGLHEKQRYSRLEGIPSQRAWSPLRDAEYTQEARLIASGRHPAREGETLIRAGGSSETIAEPYLEQGLSFRGNPVPEEGAVFLSRHPDIAAGYATRVTSKGQVTQPTRRLFAYDPKTLPHYEEAASDVMRPGRLRTHPDAVETERMRQHYVDYYAAQPRGPQTTRQLMQTSVYNPTYEQMVSDLKAMPQPVGEYRVRPSRTAAGDPAFAVQHVSGVPVQEAFAAHKTAEKIAEADDDLASLAPALGGLVLGMPTGRALAGHAAAGLAPYGRKTRSDDIARRAGYVGAPAGGIAALALSHHYNLPDRLAKTLGRGIITDKKTEQKAIRMLTPLAVGLGGSALGGLATGAITGGIQRARGPSRRRSEDTPQKIASMLYNLGIQKAAADMGIGSAVKGVRRALLNKNVDEAYNIARQGIASGSIEPNMLQRFMTPSKGITQHEADLWQIAARPAAKPVAAPVSAPTTPTPNLVDSQLAQRWSTIKAQQGW